MMARKIQSEKTKANILTVSEKLFIEKGYEKTTTQEIVDITGLSKGTVFHHFKSKEDILLAVLALHLDSMMQELDSCLASMDGLTAKEKLMRIFGEYDTMADSEKENLLFKMAIATQSPHIIVADMKKWHTEVAPIVAELIREGIADGSITTDFPDECAQLFVLLCTIWTDPVTLKCDAQAMYRRLQFIQHTMRVLGVDIVSDAFIESGMKFIESFMLDKSLD